MAANDDKTGTNSVFKITRTLKAPRYRVWKAWSEADQLKHWWGPKGCTIEIPHFEFKLGGFCHFAMKFEGAPTM